MWFFFVLVGFSNFGFFTSSHTHAHFMCALSNTQHNTVTRCSHVNSFIFTVFFFQFISNTHSSAIIEPNVNLINPIHVWWINLCEILHKHVKMLNFSTRFLFSFNPNASWTSQQNVSPKLNWIVFFHKFPLSCWSHLMILRINITYCNVWFIRYCTFSRLHQLRTVAHYLLQHKDDKWRKKKCPMRHTGITTK